ncbi:HupE/UreJ family protein [Cohnella faecalis]|uniref:HupE/UreJ family protein n=1 Tax=Cohnella faecalis TaxID=2315694 RepID=A0A398CQD4_9BACL|nr:HupE/UreJ family protein [Cohnella faecalis]RIE02998.1 HupE/UreJ family protein [Cohnella faecalis]
MKVVSFIAALPLLLLASLLQAQPAQAHLNTFGYSDIRLEGSKLVYDLYLDPREVSQWMDLRSNGVFVLESKKALAPDETSWTEEDIRPLVAESLIVKGGETAVEPSSIGDLSISRRGDVPYLRMKLVYELPATAAAYSIDYGFFYEEDPGHQNYATIRAGDSSKDVVFTKDDHQFAASLANAEESLMETTVSVPNWLATLWDYLQVGIEHIWTGTDHLLFVAALVLVKQRKWDYLKVLTAFTIGHSITIALAALDIFNLPASFVEPVIALSIAYVAVENIWMKQVKWRWIVALSFGLIHGFGFAQVLRGALGDRFILTLFSFNLGVEIGQLAVLAVLLPLLIWLGRYKGYQYVNYAASGLIALIALYWFVIRISG